MPRPRKHRRVCSRPRCAAFSPREGSEKSLTMSIDEYEAIRLIDLQGLTQEQCAEQMQVARTTIQAIYASARKTLARCIVEGCHLHIAGGDVSFCEHHEKTCAGGRCCQRKHVSKCSNQNGGAVMKVAVTYENGSIFQHFGHSQQFKLYDIAEGKIISSTVVSAGGSGHGALAGMLEAQQVDTLICGGIGAGAQNMLAQAGIKLYGGVSGSADEAVAALLAGQLAYNPDIRCDHHDGHEHGDCHSGHGQGGHDCGGHCHQ